MVGSLQLGNESLTDKEADKQTDMHVVQDTMIVCVRMCRGEKYCLVRIPTFTKRSIGSEEEDQNRPLKVGYYFEHKTIYIPIHVTHTRFVVF